MKADPRHSEEMLMRKKDDFDLYRNIWDQSAYSSSRALQIANFFQNWRENSETSFSLDLGHFLLFSSKVNSVSIIRHIIGLWSPKSPVPWASLYSPNIPVGDFHRPLICRMTDAQSRAEPHKEVHTCPRSPIPLSPTIPIHSTTKNMVATNPFTSLHLHYCLSIKATVSFLLDFL